MKSRLSANWPIFLPTRRAGRRADARIKAIGGLAQRIDELAHMEYDFLFDEARHLLAIGYNVTERRRDPSFYDLLASEARFSSFVAIAQGQLPQESWFALGRLLTTAGGEPILLSWSGSMFEYLMPPLVMPTYEHTLLDQTMKAAVARQVEYGSQRARALGHFRNRATTRSMYISTTSTAPSACPAWVSNAGSPMIWSLRRMPRHWP